MLTFRPSCLGMVRSPLIRSDDEIISDYFSINWYRLYTHMESHHAMKINIKERTVVIASQDGGVLFLEKEPFERKWSQIGNRILITCKKIYWMLEFGWWGCEDSCKKNISTWNPRWKSRTNRTWGATWRVTFPRLEIAERRLSSPVRNAENLWLRLWYNPKAAC